MSGLRHDDEHPTTYSCTLSGSKPGPPGRWNTRSVFHVQPSLTTLQINAPWSPSRVLTSSPSGFFLRPSCPRTNRKSPRRKDASRKIISRTCEYLGCLVRGPSLAHLYTSVHASPHISFVSPHTSTRTHLCLYCYICRTTKDAWRCGEGAYRAVVWSS